MSAKAERRARQKANRRKVRVQVQELDLYTNWATMSLVIGRMRQLGWI